MTISDNMAALALVNGTAGGIVLVLPIIGLYAGYIMIPVVILIASLCCYFTAVVMFQHLGTAKTINQCIMNHFHNKRFCQFYNVTMFLSFFGEMLVYFSLLVSQIQGICHGINPETLRLIPWAVAVFLLILAIITRFYNFQDDLIGCYGIISLLAFCIFIGWIIIDRQVGPKHVPATTGLFVDLGAMMSQGYSIHNMMIPIILRARNPNNYKKILLNTFVIAGIIYTFITYGCFAIVNRVPSTRGIGQTVQDYFSGQQWQVYVLRSIYILNIVTVFPEFLNISKIRFFNIFCEEEEQEDIKLKDLIYFICIIAICLISKLLAFKVSTIIELNGSIICFFQIYFIPIAIHLKCLAWDVHYRPYQKHKEIQNNYYSIEHEHEKEQDNKKNYYNQDYLNLQQQDHHNISQCPCQIQYQENNWRYLQILTSFIILLWGIFILVYTLYTVFFDDQTM